MLHFAADIASYGRFGATDTPDPPLAHVAANGAELWVSRCHEILHPVARTVGNGRLRASGRTPRAGGRTPRAGGRTPRASSRTPRGQRQDAAGQWQDAAAGNDERRLEGRIAELAARQHGLITHAKLLAIGLGRDAVKYRLKVCRLRRVQRGIYRIGPLVSLLELEMAAVLACGPGAVISHRSAGVLWRMVAALAGGCLVDVTVPASSRRARAGARVHRSKRLDRGELGSVAGTPVTSPARTLLDLAGVLRPRELEQALAAAERLGLTNQEEVGSLAARHRGHRAAAVLRSVLGQAGGPALTRSEAEERLLALVRRAQLPAPATNARIGGVEVDFLWRTERLVVEVDGFAYHSSGHRFEQDRRRDARLAAAGLRVVRITWHQLESEPEAVLARLAQTLGRCAPR